ncbi:hypothetical protein DERP_005837 [Dermatophagoides pteronyssinus]|uniref:Uncharacterized protein n=1 Tax=Dermatophagoides pteronyssinus TaxID=6956 RepID=A0ABQ8J9Q2_DERPT|nr:hypothetical protein DERP_005837 [Dermatophagoides pteronyssinus]
MKLKDKNNEEIIKTKNDLAIRKLSFSPKTDYHPHHLHNHHHFKNEEMLYQASTCGLYAQVTNET